MTRRFPIMATKFDPSCKEVFARMQIAGPKRP